MMNRMRKGGNQILIKQKFRLQTICDYCHQNVISRNSAAILAEFHIVKDNFVNVNLFHRSSERRSNAPAVIFHAINWLNEIQPFRIFVRQNIKVCILLAQPICPFAIQYQLKIKMFNPLSVGCKYSNQFTKYQLVIKCKLALTAMLWPKQKTIVE